MPHLRSNKLGLITKGENMEASVDRSGCIGCGLCAEICPEVFKLDEEGLAFAFAKVTPENEDNAIDARDSCPVSVISIDE